MDDLPAAHFIDEPIRVRFDQPPAREKAPPCPDGFTWQGQDHPILEKLAEWTNFSRRGRYARNMRPAHAARAAEHASLGVGRFYFRVRTQTGHVFELYYDRAIRNADDRKGHWFLYQELEDRPTP